MLPTVPIIALRPPPALLPVFVNSLRELCTDLPPVPNAVSAAIWIPLCAAPTSC